jgi:hypothetical protein
MSQLPSLFPSISFEEAVSEVASLPQEAYENFKKAIFSELAFDDNPERIAGLAKQLSVTPEDAAMILQATAILYERVQALPNTAESASAISRFVDEFDEELQAETKRSLVERLTELTVRNESAELNRKINRLQSGFLDTATNFSTFVDLRPDFNEQRDQIRGFLPMIQFKIATNSDNDANLVVDAAVENDIPLILAGHLHKNIVSRTSKNTPVLCAGSLTSVGDSAWLHFIDLDVVSGNLKSCSKVDFRYDQTVKNFVKDATRKVF